MREETYWLVQLVWSVQDGNSFLPNTITKFLIWEVDYTLEESLLISRFFDFLEDMHSGKALYHPESSISRIMKYLKNYFTVLQIGPYESL